GTVVLMGSGIRGIIDLLRPMFRWKVAPGWYLLAFTWASFIAMLVLLGKGTLAGAPLSEVSMNFSGVFHLGTAATILIGAFAGEIVWVSYAIRKLSTRFTPFVGSQIVGVVWT